MLGGIYIYYHILTFRRILLQAQQSDLAGELEAVISVCEYAE